MIPQMKVYHYTNKKFQNEYNNIEIKTNKNKKLMQSTNIPIHYPNSYASEASNHSLKKYPSIITKHGIQKYYKLI